MTRRVLFVCDAGPVAGGGHVMRCLTLARALVDRGASPTFLATETVAPLLDAYAPDFDRIPSAAREPEVLCGEAAAAPGFDAVVLDHYGLSAALQRRAAAGRPCLVIDDLADRLLSADLVLDPGLTHTGEDYRGLVTPETQLLLGPGYAPVRPEFAQGRGEILNRRAARQGVSRILVSLGLGDLGGITARVVEVLLPIVGDRALDVVVSAAAPSLPALKALRDPRVTLHVDSQDMAGLMTRADIAVGAGGSTSWERCILGLPTLLLVLADNQRPAAAALEAAGAVMAIEGGDFAAALELDLAELLANDDLRRGMSLAAAMVCDGQGAGRVAEALLDLMRQRASPQPPIP